MSYRIEKRSGYTIFIGEGQDKGKSFATTKKNATEVFRQHLAKKGQTAELEQETQYYVSDQVAQQTRPISPYEAQSIKDQQAQERERQTAQVISAINEPEKTQPGVAEVQEVKQTKFQKAEEKVSKFLFPNGTFDPGGVSVKVDEKLRIKDKPIFPKSHTYDVDKGTGIAGEVRRQVVKKPITTGVTFASGYVLSGVSSGLGVAVKPTSKLGVGLRMTGATFTGLYGATKTIQFVSAPTIEAKERVLGQTLYETTVFGAGAKLGSGIGQSVGYKIKVTNFERSLNKWEKGLVGKGEIFDVNKNKGFIEYDVKGSPRQTQLKPTTESGFDIYSRYGSTQTVKQPDYLKQTSLYRFDEPRIYIKPLKPTQIYIQPTKITQATLQPYLKTQYIEVIPKTPGSKPFKIKVDGSFWDSIGTKEHIPFSTATQIEKPGSLFDYENIWGTSPKTEIKPYKSSIIKTPTITIEQANKPFFIPLNIPTTKAKISTSLKQMVTPSQQLVLKQVSISKSIEIGESKTIQIQEPVVKPIQTPKIRQVSQTRQIQVPISIPVQFPTPYVPTPTKPPTTTFKRPPTKKPPTPTLTPGWFPKQKSFKSFSTPKPKTFTFKTQYKPTIYSASLNIKGLPSTKATMTGLSIRPINKNELKKKAKVRL